MTIKKLNRDKLREIARLMISTTAMSDQTWSKIVSVAGGDKSLAKRAMEWLPEAFGYVLLSHIPQVQLPNSFHVRSADGQWHEIDFSAEPIAKEAIELAMEVFHSGQREFFERLAAGSALVTTMNSALNSGADISGAQMTGPVFVNLPAEEYLP